MVRHNIIILCLNKTLWLRDFVNLNPGVLTFFLCSTFVFEPIWIKFLWMLILRIYKYTNIMKMQYFLKIKFDFRSYRTTFMLWRVCVAFLILDFQIYLTYDLMNIFCACFIYISKSGVHLFFLILYFQNLYLKPFQFVCRTIHKRYSNI